MPEQAVYIKTTNINHHSFIIFYVCITMKNEKRCKIAYKVLIMYFNTCIKHDTYTVALNA